MRLPAASIPVLFLSNPSEARLRVSVSVASEAENWVDEALRAWARVKRELVKLADSVSLLSSRLEVFACGSVVVDCGFVGWSRFRSVDVSSAADEAEESGGFDSTFRLVPETGSSPRMSSSSSEP